jgi:polysaccharide export outer membrane protein
MKPAWIPEKGKRYFSLVASFLLMAAFGCQTFNPAVTPEQMASEPLTDQILSPGDVIDIKFLYNPELNDTQRVRPDGNITLQMIGEVKAAGKGPEALQEELNKLYDQELRKPSVTVTAKALRNNKVYVGGEVNKPGDVELLGSLTALEAIGQAGGFKTDTALQKSVVIVRSRNGKHYGTVIDLQEALSGKEVKPFYLRTGDVVYVPQTNIAKVNQWVDQHINKILPRIPVSFAP